MALQTANNISTGLSTNFKFSKSGDKIEGYYRGQVNKTINGMPAVESTYKTKNGIVALLGQANILQKIKNENIKPGTFMVITFTGDVLKLKGGKTMKVYDVKFDHDDVDTDESSEEGLFEEESPSDEVELSRPSAPSSPASKPSQSDQARVQGLLRKSA